MNADRKRLHRLHRLEKVRAIAKQAAAVEAAEAETTLAQLQALAQRTRELAAECGACGQVPDGAALRQIARFTAGLLAIHDTTHGDAERARRVADGKLERLGEAERRRAAVADRARATATALDRDARAPSLAARRSTSGTGLE